MQERASRDAVSEQRSLSPRSAAAVAVDDAALAKYSLIGGASGQLSMMNAVCAFPSSTTGQIGSTAYELMAARAKAKRLAATCALLQAKCIYICVSLSSYLEQIVSMAFSVKSDVCCM